MSLYGINAYTSNYGSLYSGLYNRKSSFGNSTSELLDLAKKVDQVRSASFKKNALEEFKKIFAEENDNSTSEDSLKLSQNAKDLSGYAAALATGSADFSDPEKTLSSVKNFVESYNNTLDSIQNSDNVSILEKGVSMVNTSKAFSRTLGRIGISVGSDNRLTLNEDTLKTASEGTLKSLFSGSYSYANKIADKASFVNRAAALQSQYSNPYTYNNKRGLDFYTQMASNIFSGKF